MKGGEDGEKENPCPDLICEGGYFIPGERNPG